MTTTNLIPENIDITRVTMKPEEITAEVRNELFLAYFDREDPRLQPRIAGLVRSMVTRKLSGTIPGSAMDDFVSEAGMRFPDILDAWDGSVPFDSWLRIGLMPKLLSVQKTRMAWKRSGNRPEDEPEQKTVSYEALEEAGALMRDTTPSPEDELNERALSQQVRDYLKHLSKVQRKILIMMAEDYSWPEIERHLEIGKADIEQALKAIRGSQAAIDLEISMRKMGRVR